MSVSRTYTLVCDCPDCDISADVSVPAGQTLDENLPAGWGYFGNPSVDRYHCSEAACVTEATGVAETERAARAAIATSKTLQEITDYYAARQVEKVAEEPEEPEE